MKRIVVFGANGNIGREVCRAFNKAGWVVRAATREGGYEHIENVETVKVDGLDRQQVIDAAKDCDFIYNGFNPLYTQWNEKCLPMARNVMAAAHAHDCVHLFPGNVYNYGKHIDAQINDDTPFVADHNKAEIRIEMEALFARFARENKVKTIIIRSGDFFGGSRRGATWFDLAIVKKLHKGVFTYPGDLNIVHSFAYLPDLAKTIESIAARASQLGNYETFLVKGHAVTGAQMKSAFETVLGHRLKNAGVPWAIMRLMGIFSPMMKEVCKMSYLWREPHAMDEAKLKNLIGKVPHTPLPQALQASLEAIGLEELGLERSPFANKQSQLA